MYNIYVQFYSSGVLDIPQCSSDKATHSVLITGYGNLNGRKYWLVKNRLIINPRRACAARVTVVCVCVCVCVCLSAPFRPLQVKVSPENDTNASSRQEKENKTGEFL